MSRIVRLATEEDVDQIQEIYNHKDNGAFLGGFTMREPILSKIKHGSEIVVTDEDRGGLVIGADECGYDHTHRWKHQLVGVRPGYKRERVASAMYVFSMMKAMLSGRYILHDYIISDNCIMPQLLPTLGYTLEATQRSKVRRHKDMGHWVKDLTKSALPLDRIPERYVFQLHDDPSWEANFRETVNRLHDAGMESTADEVIKNRETILVGTKLGVEA